MLTTVVLVLVLVLMLLRDRGGLCDDTLGPSVGGRGWCVRNVPVVADSRWRPLMGMIEAEGVVLMLEPTGSFLGAKVLGGGRWIGGGLCLTKASCAEALGGGWWTGGGLRVRLVAGMAEAGNEIAYTTLTLAAMLLLLRVRRLLGGRAVG